MFSPPPKPSTYSTRGSPQTPKSTEHAKLLNHARLSVSPKKHNRVIMDKIVYDYSGAVDDLANGERAYRHLWSEYSWVCQLWSCDQVTIQNLSSINKQLNTDLTTTKAELKTCRSEMEKLGETLKLREKEIEAISAKHEKVVATFRQQKESAMRALAAQFEELDVEEKSEESKTEVKKEQK